MHSQPHCCRPLCVIQKSMLDEWIVTMHMRSLVTRCNPWMILYRDDTLINYYFRLMTTTSWVDSWPNWTTFKWSLLFLCLVDGDQLQNRVYLDPQTFNSSKSRPELEELLERIVSGAAHIADSESTRDDRKQRIVTECNALRQALQDLLTEYERNVSESIVVVYHRELLVDWSQRADWRSRPIAGASRPEDKGPASSSSSCSRRPCERRISWHTSAVAGADRCGRTTGCGWGRKCRPTLYRACS